jgi:tetrahydromethanopterin S-methyltransferase subunit D
VLEVLDADPLKEGVQIISGDFLYPANPSQVGVNLADNENGTVHYALTLTDPAPAANGTGVVCSIVFRTKGLGVSALDVVSATLMTKDVVPIPVTLYDGSVRVQTLMYLPVVFKRDQLR